MSKRTSVFGNTKPERANVIKSGGVRSINDGLYGQSVRESPFNPLINFSEVKRNMSLFFEHESLVRNCGYWKYKNLPKHLIPFNVSRMLYSRGGLVAFNHEDREELLPFVISGHNGLDYYGLPYKVIPVPYAQQTKLLVNKILTVGIDCAIWLDSIPFEPSYSPVSRQTYNNIINNEKTESLIRVKMSMVAHFEKHILKVESQAQANKLRQAFRLALENGDPVAVVTEFFEVNKQAFGGMTYVGSEFFGTLKDYSALQDGYNGISTSGYGIDRAERLVAGELTGIGEQVDINADMRRRMANRFTRECREILGWTGFEIDIYHTTQRERVEWKMPKEENDGSEQSVGGVQNV